MKINKDWLEDCGFEIEMPEFFDWFIETFPNGSTLKVMLHSVATQDFCPEEFLHLLQLLRDNDVKFDTLIANSLNKRKAFLYPGSVEINGNVKIFGNLSVGGELNVRGNLTVHGSLAVTKAINVVAGDINIHGTILCGAYIDCTGYVQGWLDIETGVDMDNADEYSTEFGYVRVGKFIQTAESIKVKEGDLLAKEYISSGNDISVTNGYIKTEGHISVDGDIDVYNCGIEAGDSIYCGCSIWSSQGVSAGKDIHIQGELVTEYDDETQLIAGGEIIADGIKSGPIKAEKLVSYGSIDSAGDIEVSGEILAKKDILAQQSIVAGKSIKAGGTIKAGEEFSVIAGYKIKRSEWERPACVNSLVKPDNLLTGAWKRVKVREITALITKIE